MEPGPRVDMHDENKSVQEHHTIVNVMIVGPETKMCVYRYDYSQWIMKVSISNPLLTLHQTYQPILASVYQ